MTPDSARPTVAVVLPFLGSATEAERILARLAGLQRQPGDEIVLVDNCAEPLGVPVPEGVRLERSPISCSAYAARNVGAERTHAPWLLFLDGDCHWPADLLDRYLRATPEEDVGAIAGQVCALAEQSGLVPAYLRARGRLDQRILLEHHVYRPMAVTANLLVRRRAWEQIGGFQEHTRSGADGDFTWRLQDAGWRVVLNETAAVEHEHRTDVRALWRQAARDGAANPWLARRHTGYPARPRVGRELVLAAGGFVVLSLTGRPQRGVFKLLDGLVAVAEFYGGLTSNASPTPPPAPGSTVLVVSEHPFGEPAPADRVEALRRPRTPAWTQWRGVPAAWAEDDAAPACAHALVRLALRRPRAVGAALRALGAHRTARLAPAALRLASSDVRLSADQDVRWLVRLAGVQPPRIRR